MLHIIMFQKNIYVKFLSFYFYYYIIILQSQPSECKLHPQLSALTKLLIAKKKKSVELLPRLLDNAPLH